MPANAKPEFLFIHSKSVPSPPAPPGTLFPAIDKGCAGVTGVPPHFLGNPGFEFFNYGNLSRFAGVSGAGARRRNPERSEGSHFGNDLGAVPLPNRNTEHEPEHGI